MIKEGVNGFCMALADSVPGVSGGTIAFIMGFYDNFIGAIDDLMRGNRVQKKAAAKYLAKLGIGWAIGMVLAVLILSSLFENHIYKVSSLFIGFIAGAIPLIVIEEKNHFKKGSGGILFLVAGMLLVIMIGVVNGNAPSAVLIQCVCFRQAVFDRCFGCFRNVFARSFRFDDAADFWSIYPRYFCNQERHYAEFSSSAKFVVLCRRNPVWCGNGCQSHQNLPETLPFTDAAFYHRNDAWFVLCDRHGADNPFRSA